jgi:hypothetical protein
MYQNDYTCYDCDAACTSCFGPNANQCNSCRIGGAFNGFCVDPCPDTYYQSSGYCFNCNLPCFTCTSYYDCLSCISGMRYLNNRCYLLCPKGYYIDGNNCSPCI